MDALKVTKRNWYSEIMSQGSLNFKRLEAISDAPCHQMFAATLGGLCHPHVTAEILKLSGVRKLLNVTIERT